MKLTILVIVGILAWILANILLRSIFHIAILAITYQFNRTMVKDTYPECFLYKHENYYLYEPYDNRSYNGIILYMHGGAFVAEHEARHFLSRLANYTKCSIYSLRYSLAPRHKFPTPIEQLLLIGGQIVSQRKSKSVFLMGDSAGAFHILQSWLTIQSPVWQNRLSSIIGIPVDMKPKGLILLSPYIDVNDSTVSSGYSFPMIYKNILNLYGPLTELRRFDPLLTEKNIIPEIPILAIDSESYSFAHHLFRLKYTWNISKIKIHLFGDQIHDFMFSSSKFDRPATLIKAFIENQDKTILQQTAKVTSG